MPAGGEYEPKDSRKVTGTKGDADKSWREEESAAKRSAEYEPEDSRNVTGQAAGDTDRWAKDERHPPRADGTPSKADRGSVSPTKD